MSLNLKTNVSISDTAYAGLAQQAYELGYVRGAGPDNRPRGLSAYVTMLATRQWADARPEPLRGTGQWHPGLEPLKERCLYLTPHTVATLGHVALDLGIFPYKSQLPVVNGWRREATPPVLWPAGATPPGRTSVKALAGPVLEAIGHGWLQPIQPLLAAPPDLYQGPSRAKQRRSAQRALAVSEAL